ncbi:MAG: transcriptional regulator [Crocinitomicaceae bacterium]|jgi:DNA-binding transcriptional ArsR family regulator|nr:transcriptional regulator [Flammeovirgaceae bacterium]MAX79793.1 transcriptional regulator [Crocinitomicaceae bacterium]MBE63270.1 transcriptional regulator [Flammeovirgaceae bacterium]MBE63576.1 transcriptional regulator [Flammeovirgaceae bacterium]HCX21929.1 transcriptional regulator [Cytophagales bacterium]|tara:strand:+ start:133 stop:501 length:369 start_codon:yes stop_codon:yes gene_type:complete
MSNTCIRVLADPVQIKECKEAIQSLEEPLADVTKVFNLARNAARLKILYLLSREGEMCPCDFSDILEISVGGVSQHLRKLKDGGIVRDKKVGQTIFYSLVKENMEMIKPILDSLSNQKEPVS